MTEKKHEEKHHKEEDKPAESIPIDGGKPVGGSLQDIAKRNYDEAEKLAAEGKQPPNLPATPVNLASFQHRETLPEEKRKELEPVDIEGHPETAKRREKAPHKQDTSVSDELLGKKHK